MVLPALAALIALEEIKTINGAHQEGWREQCPGQEGRYRVSFEPPQPSLNPIVEESQSPDSKPDRDQERERAGLRSDSGEDLRADNDARNHPHAKPKAMSLPD